MLNTLVSKSYRGVVHKARLVEKLCRFAQQYFGEIDPGMRASMAEYLSRMVDGGETGSYVLSMLLLLREKRSAFLLYSSPFACSKEER